MKLLLDTHSLLWHLHGDTRLSMKARQLLTDPKNSFFLSMATVWEIAIKSGLKKLTLKVAYSALIPQAVAMYPLRLLPITLDDCSHYETLPFPVPNHRDPFDRMLITHALRNNLSVVGNDAKFDAYGVSRLW
jgi:PIN domain nuclease of toxin-antitoxin system